MVAPHDPVHGGTPAVAPTGHPVFRHGVASGDPTSSSVVLWTRVEEAGDRAVPVTWSMWAADGRPGGRGRAWSSPEHDHTCRVVVDGLEPGTDYHFVFQSAGDRIVGRTRTLPRNADSFRFAVACCSRWGWPGFDGYAAILAEAPDLLVHLGDYIYEVGETPPDGPSTDPPHDCETLEDYRRRYRQHRGHPALRRLHATTPFLALWDDHEVADDAPSERDHERRVAGRRAWREWMPTRATASDPVLDRRVSIGQLCELVLVDARFGGRPPVDTDGPSTDRPDSALLSPSQWAGIEGAVGTQAPWLIVANQVQVAPLTLGWWPAPGWPPLRRLVNPDQWDGFPSARRRLVELLGRVTGTAVILSGDLHAGWARRLLDGRRTIAHEFTAPSIAGTSFADAVRERTGLPCWILAPLMRWFNRGIDHVDLRRHGFLVVDLDARELTVTFVHHDGTRVRRTLGSPG